MKVRPKRKKSKTRKKKKKKRKPRPNRRKPIRTKILKTPNRKRHRKAWKKRTSGRCWPGARRPGTTEAAATAVRGERAKTKVTLDLGERTKRRLWLDEKKIDIWNFRYGTSGYKSPSSTYQSPRETDSAAAASGSKYLNNTRTEPAPRFTSRFLKNKSIQEETPGKPSYGNDGKYTSDKGLSRSRTSANLEEDLPDDTNVSAYSPYSKNHYGSDLSRSRSSHALKSRETSPDRPVTNSSGILLLINDRTNGTRYLGVVTRATFVTHTTSRTRTNLIRRLASRPFPFSGAILFGTNETSPLYSCQQ